MSRRPAQFSFPTYPVSDFRVHWGANEGDPIGGANDVVAGDNYRLEREARPRQLAIWDGPSGTEVADGSDMGQPGDRVLLEVCHSLMAPGGTLVELLILTVTGEADTARVFLPLAPVEELRAGDRLLTRDHGPREIRWIGQQVQRATGALAPILIREGTLNVANDLRLFPHHRLFIWQRDDTLGAGRSEVLIKATHLVNGSTVLREEGGFIESYQILFDAHEIIYAEGVAVESLLVTPQTRAALPGNLEVAQSDADRMLAQDIEVDGAGLAGDGDTADRLTRASRGQREED